MSNVIIDKQKIDILANAISAKSGEPVTMTLAEMVEAVDGIETGGGTPTLQAKTYTVDSAGTETITADSGYDGLSSVSVSVPEAQPYVAASSMFYTENGVRMWHYRGVCHIDDEGEDHSGYIGLGTYTGQWVPRNAVPSGTTVTPTTSAQTIGGANYMMEGAVTVSAMPAGTAGTPTATKGTVSNHSVSVTPSVTNTTGYITGSTINGTAVTVTASELVSGTYTVDSSGTKDVTNYASASIPSGTAGTPSATKGTVSNHSVSVTPSVTNSTGWITGSTKTGTAVTVTAAELASGNKEITQNGTNIDVVGYSTVSVDVQGGGGGMTVGTATATPTTASASISFSVSGEPTSFYVVSAADLATGAAPYKVAAVVFDGTNVIGQYITNTNNAQMTYSSSAFSKSYSNGTLTITASGANFQTNQYKLVYTVGGNSANIGTDDVQVGSGVTSITFTGLTEEPTCFSCMFKDNIGTSSGYTRAHMVVFDGSSIYGMEMGSGSTASSNWTKSYSNGSLTITSTSTSAGGYFHQPGYYQLTYGIGGTVDIEIEPLSVTENGTYSESGKAYSPVVVNVSGGSVTVKTTTMSNTSATATQIQFTSLTGQPKAFFCRCTSNLSRNSSNRYYYIADIRWDGSSTGGVVGNKYYVYNGQYSNQTTGYSQSYSNGTLTLTTTGSQTASPGSFFNGTYELVYVY